MGKKMRLKIMTYNIQHCRNHNLCGNVIDYKNTAIPILDNAPDFVGLNEVRRGYDDPSLDQSARLGKLTDLSAYFEKSIIVKRGSEDEYEYGNAVLTSLKVLSVTKTDIPDPEEKIYESHYEHRSVLAVRVLADHREITFLVSHFGLNPDELSRAVDTVISLVDKIDTPLVLMGYFNANAENPEVKRLEKYLTNIASELDNKENTFPSDEPVICIDQIWYKGLTPISVNAVNGVYSDHRPLIAVFDM